MNRNWTDFKSLHGNIAGAREAFEDACETLFRKKYKNLHVSQVQVKQGDGGIDIFIGELGVEPITVIQCKFFLETFGTSQQSQIRESFNTAISSDKYELKEWILCIPRVIDIDENTWWFKWKHKKLKEHSKEKKFISIFNGNELIDLFKELDLYNRVFKIEDSLKIAEIHNAVVPKKVEVSGCSNPKAVLFNHYSEKNEQYYLERESDITFNKSLNVSNIWLFGKSGAGKTALVNRNLTQAKIKYCFCDLSPTNITSSNDVLIEILVTIEDEFGIERNTKEKNILKQISQILCENDSKEIVIVIDELSVSDETIIKNIASDFIKLVTHFSNQSTKDELKFVVSTISNPMDIITNKSKASDFFQYICCDSWDNYIIELFEILSNSIGIDLKDSKNNIIQSCNNSPRILKNIFRKIVASDDTRAETVSNLITLTLAETVQ
jgi:Cdc6-like AAA superfamily ATPase